MRSLSNMTSKAMSRFRGDEGASLSVEAVLILPILLWAFLATFTFFDVYRAKNLSLKGNYAVSDLLSRETNAIDMDYLLGVEKIFTYLTQGGDETWVRVTEVRCTEDCDQTNRTLKRDWSKATDGVETYTDDGVMEHLEPIVPWLALGERVIVVETRVRYEPPFSKSLTGIGEREFIDIVMTEPRFGPQLCLEGIGNC